MPKTLPLVKNISDPMLKIRFNEEMEVCFGNGMNQLDGFPICDVQMKFVSEEKFYRVADEGDSEVVGKDIHADVGEGCMNVDENEFPKFKIPDGFKKVADIKIMAEDVSNHYYFFVMPFDHLKPLTVVCAR